MTTPQPFDERRKARFCDLVAAGSTLGDAAKAVGVHRHTVTKHRRDHPDFDGRVREALDAQLELLDRTIHDAATGRLWRYVRDRDGRRVPTVDPETGEQAVDELGDPVWETEPVTAGMSAALNLWARQSWKYSEKAQHQHLHAAASPLPVDLSGLSAHGLRCLLAALDPDREGDAPLLAGALEVESGRPVQEVAAEAGVDPAHLRYVADRYRRPAAAANDPALAAPPAEDE